MSIQTLNVILTVLASVAVVFFCLMAYMMLKEQQLNENEPHDPYWDDWDDYGRKL
jgi:hypothetical protein